MKLSDLYADLNEGKKHFHRGIPLGNGAFWRHDYFEKILDVVKAAIPLLEDLPSGDTFGANGYVAAQHRAKAFRHALAALGLEPE